MNYLVKIKFQRRDVYLEKINTDCEEIERRTRMGAGSCPDRRVIFKTRGTE